MIERFELLLGALLLVTALTVDGERSDAPIVSTESPMRVSRHFVAGLEYLLVEPPDQPPDAELPMIVYLHGRASVPKPPQAPLFGVEEPARVIVPRGPERFGSGYAWMPVSASDGESPQLLDALVARAGMLADALERWQRRYPTRGRPVVVGFSQGGMLAMELAVHHPDRLSAAFPLAAWLPPSRMPRAADPYVQHPPIHALHGTRDRVLPAPRTQRTAWRLRRLGYPVLYEAERGAGHELTPWMRARLRERIEQHLQTLGAEPALASGNS